MPSAGGSPTQSEADDFISDLEKNIGAKLTSVAQPHEEGSQGAFHSIFRVPRNLREVDPKAYEPQIVSIGPYHHGKSGLQEMEMHKCRILSHFLHRTGCQVKTFLQALTELENEARQSYADSVNGMKTPEFIEMMLLDACFVIEILRFPLKGFKRNPIYDIRSLIPYIKRDLMMVENQVPFFVLDRLFNLTCGTDDITRLPQLALLFFDSVIPGIARNDVSDLTQIPPSLVALLHYSLCRLQSGDHLHMSRPQSLSAEHRHGTQTQTKEAGSSSFRMVHSVTRLRACGVSFLKVESNNFTDVEFDERNGVLKIPPLQILHSSKTIFLNLMAFEQGWPYCCNRVTSYLCFMDDLINTSQDLRHLCRKGIIDHGLGRAEQVAHLFNDLRQEFSVDLRHCYLSTLAQCLNEIAEKKRHSWMATLRHEYFRRPQATVGLVVGHTISLLCLVQTFYTVFAYYFPRSR